MTTVGNEFALSGDSYERRDTALAVLGHRLRTGTLTIVLGSGASASVGLPMWQALTKLCCDKVGVENSISPDPKILTPVDTLLHLMRSVKKTFSNESDYLQLVHGFLYDGVSSDWINGSDHPLLRAIGTLLMGSRAGSVTDVITYNFDDTLEQYLVYHGFIAQTICRFPYFSGDSDARILHPHGYLPRDGTEMSDDIVFDRGTYTEHAAMTEEVHRLWQVTIESLLYSKQALFIGVSGEDPLFKLILPRVRKYLSDRNAAGRRFVGYWLFGEHDASEAVLEDIRESYGCAVLNLDGHSDIPRFLFQIRQKCAGLV